MSFSPAAIYSILAAYLAPHKVLKECKKKKKKTHRSVIKAKNAIIEQKVLREHRGRGQQLSVLSCGIESREGFSGERPFELDLV